MGEEPSGTSVNKQKIYHIIVLTLRDTTRTALNFAVGMSQINGKNNFLHGTAISGTKEAWFSPVPFHRRRSKKAHSREFQFCHDIFSTDIFQVQQSNNKPEKHNN